MIDPQTLPGRAGPPVHRAIDPEIVAALVVAVGATAWTMTLHDRGDGEGQLLASGGPRVGPEVIARLADHAAHLTAAGVADSFDHAPGHDGSTAPPGLFVAAYGDAAKSGSIVFAALAEPTAATSQPTHGRLALRAARRLVGPYFRLWQASKSETERSNSLEAVLDTIDLGVVLLDRDGKIVFTNARARALVERGTVLRRRGSSLAAPTLGETIKLQSALALAIAMNGADAHVRALPEQSALMKLTAGDERLIVAALPARVPAGEAGAVAAMVLLLSPGGEPEMLVAPACRLYGLSAVETRLACHVVAGRSLQEASTAMRIKEQTARSYLKQIFLKTDVKRQVDLVRLLLSTLIRTHSNEALQAI